MLLAALQASQSPALDLKVDGGWVPWRAFAPGAPAARDPLLMRAIQWRDRRPGLGIGDFEVRAAGGLLVNSIAVVEIDPARYAFNLSAAPGFAPRSADSWMADTSVALAVNTGLFRQAGTPQGLVVLGGVRHGQLARWLDAIVAIQEGRPRLLGLEEAPSLDREASAFQVLPWLVRDGRVALGVTSGRRLSRTHRDRRLTLCLGEDGWVRLLLSNFEVFGQNAGTIPVGLTVPEQAAIAAATGCADAVALDGGISAQLSVRFGRRVHRMPGWREVPLMMLVRER